LQQEFWFRQNKNLTKYEKNANKYTSIYTFISTQQQAELAALKASLTGAETIAARFQDEAEQLKRQVIELELREPTQDNLEELSKLSDELNERLSSAVCFTMVF